MGFSYRLTRLLGERLFLPYREGVFSSNAARRHDHGPRESGVPCWGHCDVALHQA